MAYTKERKLTCLVVIGLVILFIGLVSMIGVGISMMMVSGNGKDLNSYTSRNCTPSASSISYLYRCQTYSGEYRDPYKSEWVAIWQDFATGYTILEDPFSPKDNIIDATRDLGDYIVNSTYPCMCNFNVGSVMYPGVEGVEGVLNCNVWDTCFFDVDLVDYLKANNVNNNRTGIILMGVGLGILGILIMITILLAITGGLSSKPDTYIPM